LGVRVEPSDWLSVGVDFWGVELKDQIASVTEDVAFSNAAKFQNLFTIAPDPNTGVNQLTFISKPLNTGKARYQGIDLDIEGRIPTPIGKLSTRLSISYMLRADYQIPGLEGFKNSLGQYGPDNQVTFRWLGNLQASLATGPFTNLVTFAFKPGYTDHRATFQGGRYSGPEIHLLNPDGSIGAQYPTAAGTEFVRKVGGYTVVDWQGRFKVTSDLTLAVGIKNLFDQDPPFSIQDGGGGNLRGYDGRYADPIGRQYYLNANYKF
jgi:iron complex outermembrane receptor protein